MPIQTADLALYRCEQIRACERFAQERLSHSEHELMERAGQAAWALVFKRYPRVRHLAVFCGSGNNAGDGFVLARLAHQQGWQVTVFAAKKPDELPSAAAHAALLAQSEGLVFQDIDESLELECDLIIDALLGIGLKGEVHGIILAAIQQINQSGVPVVSLDIPSGLNADTGKCANACVNAQLTITFIGRKAGLYTLDGLDYSGEIVCADLQIRQALERVNPFAQLIDQSNLPWPLTPRNANCHKGDFGHVLIIGSGQGMPGAVALAAKAALRSGAGAVTVATWPSHAQQLLANCPEAMVVPITDAEDLSPLFARATVCLLGPGLDSGVWGESLFDKALTAQLPMVIDATALRFLARKPQSDDSWILTPHPGEAAALLNCSTDAVSQDRFKAVAAIQQRYGGVAVLKGAGSLVQDAHGLPSVCTRGNPGMASAGMGDVLSGMIAALVAQHLPLPSAARLGVWVHAVAGDLVAHSLGERGLLASDLLPLIPKILNGLLP